LDGCVAIVGRTPGAKGARSRWRDNGFVLNRGGRIVEGVRGPTEMGEVKPRSVAAVDAGAVSWKS